MNMLKKKKKAFTLMELLAVIVLLAVLALIATPNVINLIEESRKGAVESSARNISKTAENYYAQHTLLHNERVGEIDLTDGTLDYKNKPYKGYVYFDDNGNAYIKMYQDGYCVISDYDNTTEAVKMEAKECEIKSLIIFIDLGGGTLNQEVLEFEQGDTYGELPIPTRDGYTFIGWFDKNGNPITKDTVIDKSGTIYAKWEANVYTVTLSLPNEIIPKTEGWKVINEVPTKEITFDTEYGLLPQPYKDGYTFTGWYTSGGYKINSDSTLIIPNNHTLTGQYTPNKYLITYVYNNGNTDTVQTVTYDARYNLPEPTKVGYTFLGWYDGNTKIENNSVIKILSDKTYEAKWDANKYTLSFNSNGGSSVNDIEVTYDSAYGTLPSSTKTGYNFHGWATSSGVPVTETTIVKVTEDTTLYAQWGVNTYLITYDANGGTVTPPNVTLEYNSTYGTLPTPTMAGYTFKGWYTASSGGTQVTASTVVKTAGNHSIYAQWNPITYTVAYNSNGGSGTMTSVSHTYDTAKNLTSNSFTRTGYTFAGWATSSAGSVVYANNASVKNLSSTSGATVTLYAKWNPITYTVAYNANGGSGSMTSVSHTYDTAKNLTVNSFTRTGYDFSGWATSSAGSVAYANGASVKNLSSTNGATVTLYAKWTAKTFTVTFNANGGTTPTASKTVTYDSTYSTLPEPSRTGYTFIGWFTSASGGTQITASTKVTITSVQTLYAQWKMSTYDIMTTSVAYPVLRVGSSVSGTNTAIQNFVLKSDGTIWTTNSQAKSYGYSGSSSYNYYPTITPVAANATWSQMTGISNVVSINSITLYPTLSVNNITGTMVLIQLFAVKNDGTVWTTSVSAKSYGYSGSSSYNYYPTVTPIAANATWSQMTGITNVENLQVVKADPVFQINSIHGTTALIQLFAVKKDGTVHTTSVSAKSYAYSGSSSYNYYPTVNPIAANATWSQMTGITNVEKLEVTSLHPVFKVGGTNAGIIVVSPHTSGTTVMIQLFAIKKDGTVHTANVSSQSQGYSGSSSYNYYPTVNPIAANATWSQMTGISNVQNLEIVKMDPVFTVNSVSGTTAFIQVFAVKKDGTMYTTSISNQSQGYSGSSSYNYYPTVNPIAANATWSQMSGITNVEKTSAVSLHPIFGVNSVSGTTAFIQVFAVKKDGTMYTTSISKQSQGYSGSSSYNYYPTISPIAANATWSQMSGISGVSNIENFKMDPVLPVNSVSGTTAFIQVNVVKTDGTIWNTSISPKSYGYSGSSSYNYYPTINPIAANATWSQMTGIKTK